MWDSNDRYEVAEDSPHQKSMRDSNVYNEDNEQGNIVDELRVEKNLRNMYEEATEEWKLATLTARV